LGVSEARGRGLLIRFRSQLSPKQGILFSYIHLSLFRQYFVRGCALTWISFVICAAPREDKIPVLIARCFLSRIRNMNTYVVMHLTIATLGYFVIILDYGLHKWYGSLHGLPETLERCPHACLGYQKIPLYPSVLLETAAEPLLHQKNSCQAMGIAPHQVRFSWHC